MSGGNWEYMMAVIKDSSGNPVSDTRYYDLYDYNYNLGADIWYDYTTGHLGDAINEIAATKANSSSGDRGLWYSDYAYFVDSINPWFLRGGDYNGASAGAFGSYNSSGDAGSYNSFRLVLSVA